MNKSTRDELKQILATTPPEQVIATIEDLNPPWKNDLLPWQVLQPGDEIPWQAVYTLIEQSITEADVQLARQKLDRLNLTEDA